MNGKKNILITGVNGFLGSHLARHFLAEYNVIGLEQSLDNLWRIEGLGVRVFSSDKMDEAFGGKIDCIIHTATFYGRGMGQRAQTMESNLSMPSRLLDLAVKNGCPLFINTDTVLDRFVSVYALAKNQFRDWLWMRRKEIRIINMQLEHFYGPGCGPQNFITAMIKRLRDNEPSIDLTDGKQRRDFVYYEDIVSAFDIVLKKAAGLAEPFSTFHVATGNAISIKDVMLMLKEKTGSRSHLNFGAIPTRENELMECSPDNGGLSQLGWTPKVTFGEGITKTLKG